MHITKYHCPPRGWRLRDSSDAVLKPIVEPAGKGNGVKIVANAYQAPMSTYYVPGFLLGASHLSLPTKLHHAMKSKIERV